MPDAESDGANTRGPFREGCDAYLNRWPEAANPYPFGSGEREAWRTGFNRALAEALFREPLRQGDPKMKLILVALPEDEARAVAECVTTSGKTAYTGPGELLFNGAQRIEQALNDGGQPAVLVHDAETDDDLPVARVTGGQDGAPAVIHTMSTQEETITRLLRERDEALGTIDKIAAWAIAARKSGGRAQTQQFLYGTSDLLGVERFLRLEAQGS